MKISVRLDLELLNLKLENYIGRQSDRQIDRKSDI